ncbi:cbb3-type cytochrome c oxidase subunit I [Edaphobacter sp. 12200R-103]|jgi:cytochrome c oxidase subunit 1|uniref:cytochrome c oxidase subunit I n=1 Tax=Edaphobacter sp. 12200R-103 TaxID=2703788 RepID=UPI00138BAAA6|nr:cbb3-type cytochrome c oxidase subunit I [Edaphobacter sp. 12200R-103]QHS52627.1 cytochrome c oxidase subunit I [Edaphobacter sp. 12200R-103]
MSTTSSTIVNLPDQRTATIPKKNYINAEDGLLSWLLTGDHKRIAMLYLISITFFFFIGGAFAGLIRLELLTPQPDLVASDTYNKLFSMHGIIMVFLFLVPSVPATLGNFLIPIMIGAKDLAFPKINLLSWYLYLVGGVMTLAALVMGGVDTGWTFTTPLSTHYVNTHVVTAGLAIFVAGFSSIFTGLNFIVTIHRMRAPGMTWFRMPLFVWSNYAASIMMVLGTPVLAITLVLVVLERTIHIGVFDPSLGGDPLLFQHLFWFYSHPAVYIMILPGMGVMSEIIPAFSRKRVFGYTAVAFSSVAIAVFGFFVWEHHMFIMGVSNYSALVFSLLTMLVAVPSAIKVFNWSFTLQKGSITFETPMLYAFAFIGLFTIGGLTGVFLAALGMDIHLTETYFIVAHFHYVMVGGMLMAFLGGLHFWWPKMTGRMYPESISKLSAVTSFIGFNLTFMPQFILGYLGMPRRYHAYPAEFQVLNVLSTAGATVLGIGFLMPMIYMAWSLKYGAIAGNNPWQATGLEWQIQSPPLTENFIETPIVDFEAYDFEWLAQKTEQEVTTVG